MNSLLLPNDSSSLGSLSRLLMAAGTPNPMTLMMMAPPPNSQLQQQQQQLPPFYLSAGNRNPGGALPPGLKLSSGSGGQGGAGGQGRLMPPSAILSSANNNPMMMSVLNFANMSLIEKFQWLIEPTGTLLLLLLPQHHPSLDVNFVVIL